MIKVERINDEEWNVTVESGGTTRHRVRVSPSDLERYGGSGVSVEKLIEESFKFLLEREPNTSILRQFELSVIETYFPEYPREIRRRVTSSP